MTKFSVGEYVAALDESGRVVFVGVVAEVQPIEFGAVYSVRNPITAGMVRNVASDARKMETEAWFAEKSLVNYAACVSVHRI